MATEAQKKLRSATFCGVPFEVRSSDVTVGRRVTVFEYPQRDIPFTEDLGRAARYITIAAFVTGDDYVEKMNALVEKLETKGSGELIHPWLGKMEVTPTSTSQISYTARLRIAEVTITFVESGKFKFPTKEEDTKKAAMDSGNALQDAAKKKLIDSLGFIKDAQDFVKAALSGNLNKILNIPGISTIAEVFEVATAVADLASDALTLISTDPKVFANKMANALGLGGWSTTVAAWRGVARQIKGIVGHDDLNSSKSSSLDTKTDAYTIAKTTEAIQSFVRQIEISNAIGAASLIGTELDRIDETQEVQVMAYDEMISVRDDILAMIDEEMLKTEDDEIFQCLANARSAVWNDMTRRAEDQARLISFTPPEVMPALVIAYDYYGDAKRDLEIVQRNNIRRPGFVPTAPLKLMSE